MGRAVCFVGELEFADAAACGAAVALLAPVTSSEDALLVPEDLLRQGSRLVIDVERGTPADRLAETRAALLECAQRAVAGVIDLGIEGDDNERLRAGGEVVPLARGGTEYQRLWRFNARWLRQRPADAAAAEVAAWSPRTIPAQPSPAERVALLVECVETMGRLTPVVCEGLAVFSMTWREGTTFVLGCTLDEALLEGFTRTPRSLWPPYGASFASWLARTSGRDEAWARTQADATVAVHVVALAQRRSTMLPGVGAFVLGAKPCLPLRASASGVDREGPSPEAQLVVLGQGGVLWFLADRR